MGFNSLISGFFVNQSSSSVPEDAMSKAVYDIDNDGRVDQAEGLSDGTTAVSVSEASLAVQNSHKHRVEQFTVTLTILSQGYLFIGSSPRDKTTLSLELDGAGPLVPAVDFSIDETNPLRLNLGAELLSTLKVTDLLIVRYEK